MCNYKSGVGVRVDEVTVSAKTLAYNGKRDENSHTVIRKEHGIGEDTGGMAGRYHTPLELKPVRGWSNLEDFDLVFDAGKPDWWTDGMTEQAREQLWSAIERDMKRGKATIRTDYAGELAIPWHKSGDVVARNATTLNLPLHESGDVVARNATALNLPTVSYTHLTLPTNREV